MKSQIPVFRKIGRKLNHHDSEPIWQHFSLNASLDEVREAAARVCRDYLTGRWKEVNGDKLIVKRISGGLSNFLYYVSLPDDELTPNSATTKITGGTSPQKATWDIIRRTTTDKNRNAFDNCDIIGSPGDTNANKRQRTDSGGESLIVDSVKFTHNQNNEPREVLLRIYGQMHGEDALESVITESVVFALLSERNFGPKLHGIFPGGRIEQYIPARALSTAELADHKISMKIAEKMGEIHSLNIPMSKEPDWLWKSMKRWLKGISNILNRMDWKDNQEHLKIVRAFNFETEAKWLKSVIDDGNYMVLFCHNDLQEGNILLRETDTTAVRSRQNSINLNSQNLDDSLIGSFDDDISGFETSERGSNKKFLTADSSEDYPMIHDRTNDSALSSTFEETEPDLMIIDFEYCAYNYRGFDLANHFLEWTLDYTNSEFPHFYHRKEHYPTQMQRQAFITTYLKKLHDWNDTGYEPNADELQCVEEEVRIFTMFSHLFWSLWSVVNVTSKIEFGYWEYAVVRILEYERLKQNYLASQLNKKSTIAD